MKVKKRAPVVLERWFGPLRPKAESLGSEEERRGLRTVQQGPKKEVRIESRFIHPGIVEGGYPSDTCNFVQGLSFAI